MNQLKIIRALSPTRLYIALLKLASMDCGLHVMNCCLTQHKVMPATGLSCAALQKILFSPQLSSKSPLINLFWLFVPPIPLNKNKDPLQKMCQNIQRQQLPKKYSLFRKGHQRRSSTQSLGAQSSHSGEFKALLQKSASSMRTLLQWRRQTHHGFIVHMLTHYRVPSSRR